MEKIASFRVNHFVLEPGIYVSRIDTIADQNLITYDLRITKPNAEPVMNTAEVHTIEHLGATFLRNHQRQQDVIYFGPMGCRTGFYLILKEQPDHDTVFHLVRDTFAFIAAYEGEIPGATPRDCGNYSDQNLGMANYYARKYLQALDALPDTSFQYQETD